MKKGGEIPTVFTPATRTSIRKVSSPLVKTVFMKPMFAPFFVITTCSKRTRRILGARFVTYLAILNIVL